MIAWIVIVVAILSVYGAVMWAKPTEKDKRLARIREKAILQGLKIQYCQIDDLSINGRVNKTSKNAVFYRRLLEDTQRPTLMILRTSGESGIYLPDGWTWDGNTRLDKQVIDQISELIAQQPESINAMEFASGYVGIAWDERDETKLDEVLTTINALMNIRWV